MTKDLSREEIELRLENFRTKMDQKHPDWDTAVIINKINQYYLTGTMQDGLLIVRRGGHAAYFVRRSYERALDESPFDRIFSINSYKDAANIFGSECGKTYIETEIVTVAILERLGKYFHFSGIGSLDKTIQSVRAIKTTYELALMEESGRKHNELLRDVLPSILREGMSEVELVAELIEIMLKNGHHGVTRFQMFQTDMSIGQIGFGVSSLYPSSFDGPGGNRGISAAVPSVGSRNSILKKGDLVFADIGYGVKGYHSDKTQVYMFGAKPSEEIVNAHRACIEVEKRTAELLRPGARPSDIYRTVMGELKPDFLRNFMGFGARQSKFLGHGIGLNVDELPVIAEGFNDPIEENMVFALEPKKGINGVGLVGVEDTYIVSKDGTYCITGGGTDIIVV